MVRSVQQINDVPQTLNRVLSLKIGSLCKRNFSSNDVVVDIFSNKQVYIKSCWDSDFTTHSKLTYNEISKLASRSRDIGAWFKTKTEDFILYKEYSNKAKIEMAELNKIHKDKLVSLLK